VTAEQARRLAELSAKLATDPAEMQLVMEAIGLAIADKIANEGRPEAGIDLMCEAIRKIALYHVKAIRIFNETPEGKAAKAALYAPDKDPN
jgi:hypothetical protein